MIGRLHEGLIYGRRVRALSRGLADVLPEGASVLDVGCGDGQVAQALLDLRPDLDIQGVDVLVRGKTAIPVIEFDGINIPLEDDSVDAVMFVDVLHHTEAPEPLLREAKRVARQSVVIKDHNLTGWAAGPTLRFMDWVGNARYGVALPYNYLTPSEWSNLFEKTGLAVDRVTERLGLYAPPAAWFFERSLHFVARLTV